MSDFIVKVASTKEEFQELYKLRYEEMLLHFKKDDQVLPSSQLDYSEYDNYAKHVIAIDIENNCIVGSYRIVTSDMLPFGKKFICEEEFNIDKLKSQNETIIELSRAFVKTEYRNSIVLLLLWKYVFKYIVDNNIRYVIGDASFLNINPIIYKHSLSYLYYNYGISDDLEIKSKQSNCNMNILHENEIDMAKVEKELPPLVKAYMKFQCKVSKEYFIDYSFGSLDIFILLDTTNYNDKLIHKIINRK